MFELLALYSTTLCSYIVRLSHSVSEAMTSKLKRANLALLVPMWFPNADAEALRVLTYFIGWMFLVDDEMDQALGSSPEEVKAFQELHLGTVTFVQQCLGLRDPEKPVVSSPYKTVESFRVVGEELCKRYSVGK
jgi:hypothetical protein